MSVETGANWHAMFTLWASNMAMGNLTNLHIQNFHLPSGKHTSNYGKSSFLMCKSTISMAIFNSYVNLPESSLGISQSHLIVVRVTYKKGNSDAGTPTHDGNMHMSNMGFKKWSSENHDQPSIWGYPPVICYIAIENSHRNSWFTH